MTRFLRYIDHPPTRAPQLPPLLLLPPCWAICVPRPASRIRCRDVYLVRARATLVLGSAFDRVLAGIIALKATFQATVCAPNAILSRVEFDCLLEGRRGLSLLIPGFSQANEHACLREAGAWKPSLGSGVEDTPSVAQHTPSHCPPSGFTNFGWHFCDCLFGAQT